VAQAAIKSSGKIAATRGMAWEEKDKREFMARRPILGRSAGLRRQRIWLSFLAPCANTRLEGTLAIASKCKVDSFDRGGLSQYVHRLEGAAIMTDRMDESRAGAESTAPGADETLAAGVVHDIAGALTAIAGWAELALESRAPGDCEEALTLIRRSAGTATRLARGLLAGQADAWARPAELAEQVAHLLRPMAARRDLEIIVEAGTDPLPQLPEGPCFSMLWNLTHNAVALSAPGSIVRIRLDPVNGGVRLRVIDAGPGLEAAVERRAFEAGFSRRPGGNGLGLFRVRELAATLGGQVSLRNGSGGGAIAEITLPRLESAPTPRLRQSGVIPRTSSGAMPLAGVTLLVVDDDDALRSMLAATLSRRGAACTEAASLADVERAEGPWDLALLDLSLRDGSGLRLAERLRRANAAGRVICMSGQTSMPPGATFRPDGWLRKPFEPDEVLASVLRTLADEVRGAAKG